MLVPLGGWRGGWSQKGFLPSCQAHSQMNTCEHTHRHTQADSARTEIEHGKVKSRGGGLCMYIYVRSGCACVCSCVHARLCVFIIVRVFQRERTAHSSRLWEDQSSLWILGGRWSLEKLNVLVFLSCTLVFRSVSHRRASLRIRMEIYAPSEYNVRKAYSSVAPWN